MKSEPNWESLAKFIADFGVAAHEFAQAAFEAFQPLIKVVEDIATNFMGFYKHVGWYRRLDETEEDYAKRLVHDGWLDNPDARWEYQKIVLSTPVRIIKRWLER